MGLTEDVNLREADNYNGQKKRNKGTNNNLPYATQTIKD
jgi:hypothetical protein